MEHLHAARLKNEEVAQFFDEQVAAWPLARDNYQALAGVKTHEVAIDDFKVVVQFNPARIVSSAAKTDRRSISERPCFLCSHHLPPEQRALPFLDDYLLLVNPFPIFKEHFTVVSRQHVKQAILLRLADLLTLADQLDDYTILYNGPTSGASAPDHHHFQVVTRYQLPLDAELEPLLERRGTLLLEQSDGSITRLSDYLRTLFVVKAVRLETAITLFTRIYQALQLSTADEPAMNIIASKMAGEWRLVMVPRERHRPWQYDAEGDQRFISSPGSADMGGLFITVREEDYARVDVPLLRDIYAQVALDPLKVEQVTKRVVGQ